MAMVEAKRADDANWNLSTLQQELEEYEGDLSIRVLNFYGIHYIDELGPQARYDKAVELLNKDLLIANFYDQEGDLTLYGKGWVKEFGPINLNEYRYIGLNNIDATTFLAPYCLNVAGDVFQTTVALRYIEKFSEEGKPPPILVMPSRIDIGQQDGVRGLYIFYANSFVIPFGGNESNVTFYKNIFYDIGAKPKNKKYKRS